MTTSLDGLLGRALSIRLNLQISLSSLPVVEEWMDIHLTRWLESVPLPPEMPRGHTAHFGVSLASDLSRLSWRAYGDPAGFVPKMVKYFESCKMSAADTALLDQMGNALEPQLVGSWVAVIGGKVITGWQFCDAHAFAGIAPLFADHEGKAALIAWIEDAGIDTFVRFSQAIGEPSYSDIELPVPGVSIDDQLGQVSRAFEALGAGPLPEPAVESMSTAVSTGFSVGVRIRDGRIARVSALSPALGNDVVAQLCASVGYDNKLARVQGALRAEGADRVEYTRVLDGPEPATLVDVHVIPTDAEPPAGGQDAN